MEKFRYRATFFCDFFFFDFFSFLSFLLSIRGGASTIQRFKSSGGSWLPPFLEETSERW